MSTWAKSDPPKGLRWMASGDGLYKACPTDVRCWLSPATSWSSLTSALRPGKVCVAGLRQEPACRGAVVRCREAARLRSCHIRHEVFACMQSQVDAIDLHYDLQQRYAIQVGEHRLMSAPWRGEKVGCNGVGERQRGVLPPRLAL